MKAHRAPFAGFLLLALFTNPALAASIHVLPDSPVYQIGEIITLTVYGDSEGGEDIGVWGRLVYDGVMTDTLAATQTVHTSFNGTQTWLQGHLYLEEGRAAFMNQITPVGLTAVPVDQPQIATVTLRARRVGVVNVEFDDDLWFFGFDPDLAIGTSFTIVTGTMLIETPRAVPEPSTGGLLGLGLLAIALRQRRSA